MSMQSPIRPTRAIIRTPMTSEEAVSMYHAFLTAESESEAFRLRQCLIGKMEGNRPAGAVMQTVWWEVCTQVRNQSFIRLEPMDLCNDVLIALLKAMDDRRNAIPGIGSRELNSIEELTAAVCEHKEPVSEYLWRRMPPVLRHQIRLAQETGDRQVLIPQLAVILTQCIKDTALLDLCLDWAREPVPRHNDASSGSIDAPFLDAKTREQIEKIILAARSRSGGQPTGRALWYCNRQLLACIYPGAFRSQADNIVNYAHFVTRHYCINIHRRTKERAMGEVSLDKPDSEDRAIELPDFESDPIHALIEQVSQETSRQELSAYFKALWAAIKTCSSRQAGAVVMGLGASVLRWWLPMRVATQAEIASKLEVTHEILDIAFQKPNLTNVEIAYALGLMPVFPPETSPETIKKEEKQVEKRVNSLRFEAYEKIFGTQNALIRDPIFLKMLYLCLYQLATPSRTSTGQHRGSWSLPIALFTLHHRYRRFCIVRLWTEEAGIAISDLNLSPYLVRLPEWRDSLPHPLQTIVTQLNISGDDDATALEVAEKLYRSIRDRKSVV